MKQVFFTTVISVTVFIVLSVSAQKGADISLPRFAEHKTANFSNSKCFYNHVHQCKYYLSADIDSPVYCDYKTVSIALLSNNQSALNYAPGTRTLVVDYNLKMQQNHIVFLDENLLNQEQQKNIFIIALILFLLAFISLLVLFLKKNKALKDALKENAEHELRRQELRAYQKETEETNQKLLKLQQETEEKKIQLEKVNNIKDKIIPMIAHDIRSPLASIQNALELTRENILNPEEFLKLSFALEADIYNIRGMLDNMLLWAREQIVEIKVSKSKFNISKVIQDVIFLHRNSLITKNITIHNYLPPTLEVFSDKEILTAVLRNIFSNAVKFTSAGKNIYISQIFLSNRMYISVKDEGKGMDAATIEKIKNREHISKRGTANEKGTGIGIMFCKDLLTKLDEVFDITSFPGEGTSVTFSIKLAETVETVQANTSNENFV